jgi:hypothetical protein
MEYGIDAGNKKPAEAGLIWRRRRQCSPIGNSRRDLDIEHLAKFNLL